MKKLFGIVVVTLVLFTTACNNTETDSKLNSEITNTNSWYDKSELYLNDCDNIKEIPLEINNKTYKILAKDNNNMISSISDLQIIVTDGVDIDDNHNGLMIESDTTYMKVDILDKYGNNINVPFEVQAEQDLNIDRSNLASINYILSQYDLMKSNISYKLNTIQEDINEIELNKDNENTINNTPSLEDACKIYMILDVDPSNIYLTRYQLIKLIYNTLLINDMLPYTYEEVCEYNDIYKIPFKYRDIISYICKTNIIPFCTEGTLNGYSYVSKDDIDITIDNLITYINTYDKYDKNESIIDIEEQSEINNRIIEYNDEPVNKLIGSSVAIYDKPINTDELHSNINNIIPIDIEKILSSNLYNSDTRIYAEYINTYQGLLNYNELDDNVIGITKAKDIKMATENTVDGGKVITSWNIESLKEIFDKAKIVYGIKDDTIINSMKSNITEYKISQNTSVLGLKYDGKYIFDSLGLVIEKTDLENIKEPSSINNILLIININ